MNLFKFGKKKVEKGVAVSPEGFESLPAKGTGRRKSDKLPPYLSGKHEWNSQIGWLLSKHRIWQVVALLSLIICLGSVGGIIYIGSQSKFVPYIVEVDKLGASNVVRIADRAAPVDGRVVFSSLASFIHDARTVTSDVELQKRAVFNVYSMLNPADPGTAKMNEWLNGKNSENPFVRATKVSVSVDIASVLQQSDESWQVEWTESVRDKEGLQLESFKMRALIQVYIAPPSVDTTIEQIKRNPIGIFIKDYNWSKQTY